MAGILTYPSLVREKKDGQSSQREHKQEKHSHSENDSNHSGDSESDPEKIDQAVEAFQTELDAQANGLNASVVGNGPGLKVILKDNAGGVVRQLTGEEFLKLREATSPLAGNGRGKILDQKL